MADRHIGSSAHRVCPLLRATCPYSSPYVPAGGISMPVFRVTLTLVDVLLGDGNGDGTVNDADYDAWKAHFGATVGSGSGATGGLSASASAAVPEPASLVLVALAAIAVWLRPRRRR